MPSVSLAVEGPSDAVVLARILAAEGLDVFAVYGQEGKAKLDASLNGYNRAAAFRPWLVARDMDSDADCAPTLAEMLLPNPAQWMRFRIVVRSIEAWLLADADAIASYLRVRRARVPAQPDALRNPKQSLVNLARQSTRPAIVEDMVPGKGVSSTVGPAYSARLMDFVNNHWRLDVAVQHSDSLYRCVLRVRELTQFA